MSLEPDLAALLKRLKLGKTLATLPDRLALARAQKLDYAAFLTLILADEVQRRDNLALERRLLSAGFEERVTLEHFDWSTPIHLDRRHLNECRFRDDVVAKELAPAVEGDVVVITSEPLV